VCTDAECRRPPLRGVAGALRRAEYSDRRENYTFKQEQDKAATRLQAMIRKNQAVKKVEIMRSVRMQSNSKAATTIRKHWLRKVHRRRYLELRQEFLSHEGSIKTIQRYTRGYLVRLRMWRDAIRAEEELWAAVEIQRCWRGYLGRLKWELEYEAVWSREAAAKRLQRYSRGWLTRTRVNRLRRKMARAEFEKARRRFKSAQKIQALVRGVQARTRIRAFRERKIKAILKIQRVHRGHMLRINMWEKVLEERTKRAQGLIRGFLVRNVHDEGWPKEKKEFLAYH